MTDEDRDRHEFANHLSIIVGFADMLLADAPASDPRRGDLEQIHAAATAALDLLGRLYPAPGDTPT